MLDNKAREADSEKPLFCFQQADGHGKFLVMIYLGLVDQRQWQY
jgi:hypothetical protein